MSKQDLKCCVPNCVNTTGIFLPQDRDLLLNVFANLNLKYEEGGGYCEKFLCKEHCEISGISIGPGESEEEQQIVLSSDVEEEEDESSEEIEIVVCNDELKMCRLCLENVKEAKNIFEDFLEDTPIFSAIASCIYPLKILKGDQLPKEVCLNCLAKLSNSFKFRASCLRNDKVLKKLYPQGQKRKLEFVDQDYDNFRKQHCLARKTETEVEVKLREIVKDTLGEKKSQAENILIQVENGDDVGNEENKSSENVVAILKELTLPIVIKHVSSDWDTKSESNKRFIKTVGSFKSETLTYAFDTQFFIVDDYVFDFRLNKGHLKYLKCVAPTCTSMGYQENTKDNKIEILKPHNHLKPSREERKRQMFYHVMRKKIYNDKNLNIRSVYDQMCQYDPELKSLINIKNVIGEICQQLSNNSLVTTSFDNFYSCIDEEKFGKLQFTQNGNQFYQEKFSVGNGKAIIFANKEVVAQLATNTTHLMYVDASFQLDTTDNLQYHLVTAAIWTDFTYYPIFFALVNVRSKDIYKKVFQYLHDIIAPELDPEEIITEYEANLYYALAEVYSDSTIGGAIFYYTQNLYKKICSLNLAQDLETNTYFRNIYHMLLMLPLLPVNTILDGLTNIQTQARDLQVSHLCVPLFDHVYNEWIMKVTPDFFCVHRMVNRINESITAPFKKLRDFLMFAKGKVNKNVFTVITVVEKLIELENYLQSTYSFAMKKSTIKDVQSQSVQKKGVLKAWQHIESFPKININKFFNKVLSYIKCMENQLWIWGFYRYSGNADDELIVASNFLIADQVEQQQQQQQQDEVVCANGEVTDVNNESIIMEAVIDENGQIVLQKSEINKYS